MGINQELKEIKRSKQTTSVCWNCKAEVCEEGVVQVFDRYKTGMELCHDCYSKYQRWMEGSDHDDI